MSSIINPVTTFDPWEMPTEPVRRFTVAEYHRLIEIGFFGEDESYELIEGWLVRKMTKGPRHEYTLSVLDTIVAQQLPASWLRRCQLALTLLDSEPEPDIAIVQGPRSKYTMRHPLGNEAAIVIEISDVTLLRDQVAKLRSYARAGVPEYWIVDVNSRCVHVYTKPVPAGVYEAQRTARYGETLTIALDDVSIPVSVSELFPT
jgi:Uma2 family endonuclease